MLKPTFFAIIGALALSTGAALAADDDGDGRDHGGHFDELDANGDGAITREELNAKHKEFFKEADENGDGRVTKEEMKAFHKRRMADKMMEHLGDANGDGAISRGEFDAKSAERFAKIDKNGDGQLSAEELRAAHEGRRGHR